MDLIDYIGLRVHIILTNGYYYRGTCTKADETSISILDKNGRKVTLTKEVISTIYEVNDG